MKIEHKVIFDFNGEWKPNHLVPKVDGYYMTIRCGLGGIYTQLDEFRDGGWQVKVLDNSSVIAYSKEQITDEQVQEWYNEIMKNINIKLP